MNLAKTSPKTFGAMILLASALAQAAPLSPRMVNPANGHVYLLLDQATWKRSEAEAVALGGHLATIRNQAEEDWIFKTFGSYGEQKRLLWIGLSDTEKKFHFGWSSGESVSYTQWADQEPNNVGNGEDFVAIFYPGHHAANKWNDWDDRETDPIELPMNGVVEIIPKTTNTSAVAGNISVPAIAPIEITPVEIRPSFTVTNDSHSIRLTWPVSAADYVLEATTNLSQPFALFGYSEIADAESKFISVTITNPCLESCPQMFFRLRKP
jgi:hypothetical protein